MLNPAKLMFLRGMNAAFRLGMPGRITLSNLAYRSLRPTPSAVRVREAGITLEVDLANQELRYIFARAYERSEAAFIQESLNPGDVFIDVGANIGYLSAIAASAVGNRGQVYALEADPRTFQALKVAADDSAGRIRAFHLAVGDGSSDSLAFYLAPTEHAMWSSTLAKAGRERVDVPAISLTEFFRQHKLEPNFVKIDVEGAEASVLRGLLPYATTARRRPTILCEMNPGINSRQGLALWPLCRPFVEAGYRLRSWEGRQVVDVSQAWIEARTATFNLVMVESTGNA